MEFEHLLLDRSEPVWVLTINRPDVRNAVGLKTFDELDRAIALVEQDPECRAVVLTAAGSNFVAGGDLKELQGLTEREQVESWSTRAKVVLRRLANLPVPVVAAVEGHAIGGGCEIALACDMRIVGESARFSFWEVKNAVTTGWGGTRRLLKLVGRGLTLELLLSGNSVSSSRAQAIGLVNQVVPNGMAKDAAMTLARNIASQPPLAVQAAKALTHGVDGVDEDTADALETELFLGTWFSEDHQEAVNAFLEKRRPVWVGR